MSRKPNPTPATPSGLPARAAATSAMSMILDKGQPLESALDQAFMDISLEARDRAYTHLLVRTTLRKLGQVDALIKAWLERPLPDRARRVQHLLRIGLTQLLWLDTPPHAAVHSMVELAKTSDPAHAKLVNALLQRAAREGKAAIESTAPLTDNTQIPTPLAEPLLIPTPLAEPLLIPTPLAGGARGGCPSSSQHQGDEGHPPPNLPPQAGGGAILNTPPWLYQRWRHIYGEPTATAIADAHQQEPPLDITAPRDTAEWANRLGGDVIGHHTIRIPNPGMVSSLPGYTEGAWWVQDVAATLPALLLGDVAGKRVVDLCAAPGGKTMQLAAMGAHVTAVDISKNRLRRLRENLDRTGLNAELCAVDASTWQPEHTPDMILLDAPCSATGTIRRHPDIPWHRRQRDIDKLAITQARLLAHACDLLAPGGVLVYATCSLEPEEGESQIEDLLNARQDIMLDNNITLPVMELMTSTYGIRTLPSSLADKGGMDGFFMCRLVRK